MRTKPGTEFLVRSGSARGRAVQCYLTVRFIFIAVRRDQLLPALVEGKGDIAAANLTVTPERRQLVDFAAPILTDVREVVLTRPQSPAVANM